MIPTPEIIEFAKRFYELGGCNNHEIQTESELWEWLIKHTYWFNIKSVVGTQGIRYIVIIYINSKQRKMTPYKNTDLHYALYQAAVLVAEQESKK